VGPAGYRIPLLRGGQEEWKPDIGRPSGRDRRRKMLGSLAESALQRRQSGSRRAARVTARPPLESVEPSSASASGTEPRVYERLMR
jgi:hypothetical protein